MKPYRIAVIGAGVVARALAFALEKSGMPIDKIGARNQEKAIKDLTPYHLQHKVTAVAEAASEADVVLISVSDDSIQTVVDYLYLNDAFKKGAILVHFSGTISSTVLRNSSDNMLVASAHPLQTFPNVDAALSQLKNSYWFCEGDDGALDWIRQLVAKIGKQFVKIKTENKVYYHLGAVFACNYLTTLVNTAQACHQKAGIDKDDSLLALKPLIEATLANIFQLGTTNALTGPIARGDINTVTNHLEGLKHCNPKILTLYKELGAATLEISRAKGMAGSQRLLELEQLFDQ